MRRKWEIEININDNEFISTIDVYANSVEKKDNRTIVADGVKIEFNGMLDLISVKEVNE